MTALTINNSLPGATPQKIAHPIALAATALLTGPIIGGLLMWRNARHLGCRDLRRQKAVLVAAAVVTAVGLNLAALLDGAELTALQTLAKDLCKNLAFIAMLLGIGFCHTRQTQLTKLHAEESGEPPLRLVTSALIALIGWALTFCLLVAAPVLGRAMGGLAYILG